MGPATPDFETGNGCSLSDVASMSFPEYVDDKTRRIIPRLDALSLLHTLLRIFYWLAFFQNLGETQRFCNIS
jgi:hypothetical protein